MKRMILCILLMVSLVAQTALASCNPRQIQEQQDGSFKYPLNCHLEFGQLRLTSPMKDEQIQSLKKSLKLKDLALDVAEERVDMWKSTTYKIEDKFDKYVENSNRTKWIYFGLGVLAMGGAVYAAGRLR